MPKLALFDLDNTLVDRVSAYRRWADAFCADRGLDETASAWLCDADNDGFADRQELMTNARSRFALDDSVDDLVAAYWAEYFSHYRPDGEVIDSIWRLRQAGWRTGVITNGPSTQHQKVSGAGLLGLFDAYCVSGEVGYQKPDPQIFLEAFRRCRHDVSDGGWMIGDADVPDIGGGRGVGLKTIWIHRGRSWSIDEYRPDRQAGSIKEAVEILLSS